MNHHLYYRDSDGVRDVVDGDFEVIEEAYRLNTGLVGHFKKYGEGLGWGSPNCLRKLLDIRLTPDPRSRSTLSTKVFPMAIWTTSICLSTAIAAKMGAMVGLVGDWVGSGLLLSIKWRASVDWRVGECLRSCPIVTTILWSKM